MFVFHLHLSAIQVIHDVVRRNAPNDFDHAPDEKEPMNLRALGQAVVSENDEEEDE